MSAKEYNIVAAPAYQPGDAKAVMFGEIALADGTVVHGLLMTFPAGPPPFPVSSLWDRTPFVLAPKINR